MAFYYNVIIKEDEPDTPVGGWFWIKPSISQAYIYINDSWKVVAGGNPIANYQEGNFWKVMVHQAAAPAVELGKIWENTTTHEVFIYLDAWKVFVGA